MAVHIKIKSDRGTEIHFAGVFDDHTLCGLSTSSDDGIEIKGQVPQKVNCQDCIKIVDFCKAINNNEFKK